MVAKLSAVLHARFIKDTHLILTAMSPSNGRSLDSLSLRVPIVFPWVVLNPFYEQKKIIHGTSTVWPPLQRFSSFTASTPPCFELTFFCEYALTGREGGLLNDLTWLIRLKLVLLVHTETRRCATSNGLVCLWFNVVPVRPSICSLGNRQSLLFCLCNSCHRKPHQHALRFLFAIVKCICISCVSMGYYCFHLILFQRHTKALSSAFGIVPFSVKHSLN